MSNFLFYRYCYLLRYIFFFFFQAEDGIRDDLVTGVQTCALPISPDPQREGLIPDRPRGLRRRPTPRRDLRDTRSEERRVGKECRSRWRRGHEKKKNRKGDRSDDTQEE